jgi:hypothetical protein
MCSKFVFGIKTSFYNDAKLVLSSYKEAPLSKDSVVNTDHGKNHLSKLVRDFLIEMGACVSAGKAGKSTDNREVEHI